jgi:hypothetical protein
MLADPSVAHRTKALDFSLLAPKNPTDPHTADIANSAITP